MTKIETLESKRKNTETHYVADQTICFTPTSCVTVGFNLRYPYQQPFTSRIVPLICPCSPILHYSFNSLICQMELHVMSFIHQQP